ncbi:YybH family protein [Spirosoma koreense]
MKTNQLLQMLAVVMAMFLFAAGCNTPAKETATQTTNASVQASQPVQVDEKEIDTLTKEFFKNVEKLDIETCMSFFEDSPDFLSINPDGTVGDYGSLKKLNADGFSQMASFKLTPKKEAIRILSDSQVLYAFNHSQDATLKNGQKLHYENVSGTMLFTKINGAWKATFYQESASPPVAVK